jgi:hypothetical protein
MLGRGAEEYVVFDINIKNRIKITLLSAGYAHLIARSKLLQEI